MTRRAWQAVFLALSTALVCLVLWLAWMLWGGVEYDSTYTPQVNLSQESTHQPDMMRQIYFYATQTAEGNP